MNKISTREAILGSGAGGPLPAPTPWSLGVGYVYYPGGVVLGTPAGGNKGPGTLNAANYYINGVLIDLTKYLPYTGGIMTGMLSLVADPINLLDAATKGYVDNSISAVNTNLGNYLLLTGGTLTGPLTTSGTVTLSADPTANLQAATKQYVDSKLSGLIGIPDAPSDGTTYARNNGAWSNVFDAGTY